MKKIMSLCLAYLFLGLALIGVFLPLIPTVPFLLLASWFAVHGSDKLHDWLWTHPRFGKSLRDWEQHGSISQGAKLAASCMLVLSWVVTYLLTDIYWLPIVLGVFFSIVLTYIYTRPTTPVSTPGNSV